MGKLLAFRSGAHRPRVNGPRRRAANAARPCDFCLAARPTWRHQSLDFAACEACHQQVETGGRQVVGRALKRAAAVRLLLGPAARGMAIPEPGLRGLRRVPPPDRGRRPRYAR
jgi:hypothetical protein